MLRHESAVCVHHSLLNDRDSVVLESDLTSQYKLGPYLTSHTRLPSIARLEWVSIFKRLTTCDGAEIYIECSKCHNIANGNQVSDETDENQHNRCQSCQRCFTLQHTCCDRQHASFDAREQGCDRRNDRQSFLRTAGTRLFSKRV
jgi:hypothetical protein